MTAFMVPRELTRFIYLKEVRLDSGIMSGTTRTVKKLKEFAVPGVGTARIVHGARANLEESADIAARHGGRLISVKEFLSARGPNPKIFKQVEGNGFWSGDMGTNGLDYYCRIESDNSLVQMTSKAEWAKLPFEQRASLYKRGGELSIEVCAEGEPQQLHIGAGDNHETMSMVVYVIPEKQPEVPIVSVKGLTAEQLRGILRVASEHADEPTRELIGKAEIKE